MSNDRRWEIISNDRAISPVAGKTLELGIGIILIALLTTSLLGGVTPGYQSAVGLELADRVVIGAADRIESTAEGIEDASTVDRRIKITLPQHIRQKPYRIIANTTADGTYIQLQHPDPAISASTRVISQNLITVTGSVRSETPSWIRLQAHTDIFSNRSRSNTDTVQDVGKSSPLGFTVVKHDVMRIRNGPDMSDRRIIETDTGKIPPGDSLHITIVLTDETEFIGTNTTAQYMEIHT